MHGWQGCACPRKAPAEPAGRLRRPQNPAQQQQPGVKTKVRGLLGGLGFLGPVALPGVWKVKPLDEVLGS